MPWEFKYICTILIYFLAFYFPSIFYFFSLNLSSALQIFSYYKINFFDKINLLIACGKFLTSNKKKRMVKNWWRDYGRYDPNFKFYHKTDWFFLFVHVTVSNSSILYRHYSSIVKVNCFKFSAVLFNSINWTFFFHIHLISGNFLYSGVLNLFKGLQFRKKRGS